jgi:adenosylcobinamide-phosphate synthase
MRLSVSLPILAAALAIEAAFGYPRFVYSAVGHPVIWIGRLLDRLEAWLNRPAWPPSARRLAGVATLSIVLLVAGGVTSCISLALPPGWVSVLVLSILGSSLLAQRSLDDHVRDVAVALETRGLTGARVSVAMIVGRNPDVLDEAGVARAAIESLAENFSDGVVAPAFWFALFGLPGAALYKAANTADSMIGHRSTRYAAFGWAAARFDDLLNLPASRLAALWLCGAALFVKGASPRGAFAAVWRDARHHRSPNAGWPEAAMAGALGLKLAGPRVYDNELVEDAYMGDGRHAATAADIRRALHLARAAGLCQWIVVMLLAILIGRG